MKRFAILLLMFSAFCCRAQSNAPKPGDPPSKALMAAVLVPFSNGNPDAAAPFYDKSAKDVFFDAAPLQYQGWQEYAAGVKQVLAEFSTFKLTLRDDAVVHSSGSTAWATATFAMDGKMKNGNKVSQVGRWTCIWQKKGSKWLIVHEHVSFPWAPETEARQR